MTRENTSCTPFLSKETDGESMSSLLDDEVYEGRSPVAVGARLKLMREVLSETQVVFASRMDMQQNTYAQLERGRNYPSNASLWKLIDSLQDEMVDMNWILGGDPSGLKTRFSSTLKAVYDARQRNKSQ